MDDEKVSEIITYVNNKYNENVPRPVRFVVRKKAKLIERFDPSEMPESLRSCTVEEYISIVKKALAEGTLKL